MEYCLLVFLGIFQRIHVFNKNVQMHICPSQKVIEQRFATFFDRTNNSLSMGNMNHSFNYFFFNSCAAPKTILKRTICQTGIYIENDDLQIGSNLSEMSLIFSLSYFW